MYMNDSSKGDDNHEKSLLHYLTTGNEQPIILSKSLSLSLPLNSKFFAANQTSYFFLNNPQTSFTISWNVCRQIHTSKIFHIQRRTFNEKSSWILDVSICLTPTFLLLTILAFYYLYWSFNNLMDRLGKWALI